MPQFKSITNDRFQDRLPRYKSIVFHAFKRTGPVLPTLYQVLKPHPATRRLRSSSSVRNYPLNRLMKLLPALSNYVSSSATHFGLFYIKCVLRENHKTFNNLALATRLTAPNSKSYFLCEPRFTDCLCLGKSLIKLCSIFINEVSGCLLSA